MWGYDRNKKSPEDHCLASEACRVMTNGGREVLSLSHLRAKHNKTRLLKVFRNPYDKQCVPRSDCSYWSILIWVHAVWLFSLISQNVRHLYAAANLSRDDVFCRCMFVGALMIIIMQIPGIQQINRIELGDSVINKNHIKRRLQNDIFYSEMISSQFTSERYNLYIFTVAKQDLLIILKLYLFQKVFNWRIFVRSNAMYVMAPIANQMASPFGLE